MSKDSKKNELVEKSDVKGKEIRISQETDFRSSVSTKVYKCSYCYKPVNACRVIFIEGLGFKYICANKECMHALVKDDIRACIKRNYPAPKLRSPIFKF